VAAILLAGAGACSPVPLGDGPRLMVVKTMAREVIGPALMVSATRARDLPDFFEFLASSPSPRSLMLARDAWVEARQQWKACSPMLFGPGRDVASAVDWFPVDRKKIDELLASADPLTTARVAALGASRRGFHAMELLLFDDATAGYVAEAALLDPGPATERRRIYLVGLAQDLGRQLDLLWAAWTPGPQLAAFTGPGQGSSPYPTVAAAIDTVVNESITTAERAANLLSKPLGLMSGGEPRPELAESLPSDQVTADLMANLRGIRDLYLGTRTGGDGNGITVLIEQRSPGLDRRMRAALATALDRLAAIPHPFRAALLARDPSVTAAYEAVREVKRLASTELVANLGATVKFNDNDGD
jgi:predicted lipoprotein